MPRILGRGGASLGPTYEVEGTTVAIDNIESRDVHLVDAMGDRIWSERLCTSILREITGAIAANTAFNFGITPAEGIADCPNRILAVNLIAKTVGSLENAAIYIRDPDIGRDVCIWAWDLGIGDSAEFTIRWDDDDAGVTNDSLHVPGWEASPQMLTRIGLGGPSGVMPTIQCRGQTAAAQGGTFIMLVQVLRPQQVAPGAGEAPSHGLPIPSW